MHEEMILILGVGFFLKNKAFNFHTILDEVTFDHIVKSVSYSLWMKCTRKHVNFQLQEIQDSSEMIWKMPEWDIYIRRLYIWSLYLYNQFSHGGSEEWS